MRIGVTYDLRADYLAKGMSEEDSAEFDSEITIAAICQALSGLGHEPVRIGHVRALTQRLAAGERWDAVFNLCEGVHGYAREAQAPALLEAYGIPFVFSDALTLAVSLDKAWTKHIVSASGVPLLGDCLSRFECTRIAAHDGGDHLIIVARVTGATLRDGAPLLFSAGVYGRFDGAAPVMG